jgi:AcrR family transcriptional regulator
LARTSQDTRERILEAAEAALESQSSRLIQLRDIAAQVGVSASLIVQYFGGKEELVFEASLRRLIRNSQDQVATLSAIPPERMTLALFVDTLVERDFRHSHVGRDLLSQSWWWSKKHELRLLEVIKPRLDAAHRALAAITGAPADADLSVELHILSDIYYAGLRQAWIFEMPAADAAAAITSRMARVVEPLRLSFAKSAERR